MSLVFSPVANANPAAHGLSFSARRLDLQALDSFSAPIMGFDHYRMNSPTFAPHPHAGFSAVSYVFEDSEGGLRNRDSLGNDVVVEPGAMVWTQAGSGVIHDEFPARDGQQVHGLQLFVNLARVHKRLKPQMLYVRADEVPTIIDSQANRIRVLAGKVGTVGGPINPVEPFDFLDVQINTTWSYSVPAGRNAMVYALSGELVVSDGSEQRALSAHQALVVRADANAGELLIKTSEPTRVLILSGIDPKEPVAAYGPFIMNSSDELEEVYLRYRDGKMGHLSALE